MRRRAMLLWPPALASAATAALATYLVPQASRLNDLRVFRLGGHVALQAGPLYDAVTAAGYPFTYPSFAALLFTPLAALPFGVVAAAWLAGSVAALVIALRLLTAQRPPWVWPLAVAALAWTIPVRNDFRFGQVELFLLLAVVADLRSAGRAKGVLVGLATAVKLTPGLFAVYYLATRQWRAGLTAVATFVGATLLGLALLPRQTEAYLTRAVFDFQRYGVVGSAGNQSLKAAVGRLGLTGPGAAALVAVATLLVVGLALFAVRRAVTADVALVAAVIGCSTALVSPLSWTHHFVWLLPAAVTADRWLPRRAAIAVPLVPAFVAALYASPLLPFDSLTLAALAVVVAAAAAAWAQPSSAAISASRSTWSSSQPLGTSA